jgi:small-conductance mechanosensitive channel
VEEIAAVEADVAHLKQKVADLHLQLNQQRQQQHGMSVADSSERQHRVKSLQAQQRILQQELEITLALCNHEKQRNNEVHNFCCSFDLPLKNGLKWLSSV